MSFAYLEDDADGDLERITSAWFDGHQSEFMADWLAGRGQAGLEAASWSEDMRSIRTFGVLHVPDEVLAEWFLMGLEVVSTVPVEDHWSEEGWHSRFYGAAPSPLSDFQGKQLLAFLHKLEADLGDATERAFEEYIASELGI